MLSVACKDSIRAMIYIAKYGDRNSYLSIHKIAEDLDLSFYFLSKNLQKLVKVGLLESYRGPNGGVRLAKPPDQIKLLDIIDAIDGTEFFNKCILGFDTCSDENPCVIHHKWAEKRNEIYEMFFGTTLSEAVEDIHKFSNIKI
ncbi:RrF2 family transcriptional regulator [Persephonella sp.]